MLPGGGLPCSRLYTAQREKPVTGIPAHEVSGLSLPCSGQGLRVRGARELSVWRRRDGGASAWPAWSPAVTSRGQLLSEGEGTSWQTAGQQRVGTSQYPLGGQGALLLLAFVTAVTAPTPSGLRASALAVAGCFCSLPLLHFLSPGAISFRKPSGASFGLVSL